MGGLKEWMDGWVKCGRGVGGLWSLWSKTKIGKITLSFTSPDFFLKKNYEVIVKQKKKKHSTYHYSCAHACTHKCREEDLQRQLSSSVNETKRLAQLVEGLQRQHQVRLCYVLHRRISLCWGGSCWHGATLDHHGRAEWVYADNLSYTFEFLPAGFALCLILLVCALLVSE